MTYQKTPPRGLTLVELMVALVALAGIAIILTGVLGAASSQWVRGEAKVESQQSGRAALELISREMTGATIDPCQQFVVMTGESLEHQVKEARQNQQSSEDDFKSDSEDEEGSKDEFAVDGAMVALWMAPLGVDGTPRVVGYYLQEAGDTPLYRLKRIYVGPENEDYYPGPADGTESSDSGKLTQRLDPDAFNDSDPENNKAIVSTVSDGVLAFWVQSFDALDNEIPWVSSSEIHPECSSDGVAFNSAALFQMATTEPFEDGSTFTYYSDPHYAVKGDRIPAAVEITMVTLDEATLKRMADREIPMPECIMDEEAGTLDVEASLEKLITDLEEIGIREAHTFSTRVKLANGT